MKFARKAVLNEISRITEDYKKVSFLQPDSDNWIEKMIIDAYNEKINYWRASTKTFKFLIAIDNLRENAKLNSRNARRYARRFYGDQNFKMNQ